MKSSLWNRFQSFPLCAAGFRITLFVLIFGIRCVPTAFLSSILNSRHGETADKDNGFPGAAAAHHTAILWMSVQNSRV